MILGVSMVIIGRLPAQETAQVTALLQQLKPGTEPKIQLEALHAIATSLDPRIPPACLPLLQSPGTSLQRNAARAIGSRWWQIPPDQLAAYVQALQKNLRSGNEQLENMTRRGIGLLARTYDNDMFSRSRSKRWVIYERHGKPCVIDTRNHKEELLGFGIDGNFMPAFGNAPLTQACHWHPKQEMVALDMLLFRRPGLLWVWRPAGGLRPFAIAELSKLLKPAGNGPSGIPIQSVDFKAWKGTGLEFTVSYSVRTEEVSEEHTALLRWESAQDTLRVLSDRVEE